MIKLIGTIMSYLWPYPLAEKWYNLKAKAYAAYLRRFFLHLGRGSYVFFPSLVLKGLKNISVGDRTTLGEGIQLTAWGEGRITIGNDCKIRAHSHITAVNSITIGDNFLTVTNVLVTDNSHGAFVREQLDIHPANRPVISKGPVVIGNNVWLGNNVCIMPGVTIGNGVVVAANSVVTHDVPDYTMVAGTPAKVVKSI